MASPPIGGQNGYNARPFSLNENVPSMPVLMPVNNNQPEEHHESRDYLNQSNSGERLDSSLPGTPNQALLPNQQSSGSVQFAAYRDDKNEASATSVWEENEHNSSKPEWLPVPLRLWFWLPFVVFLALGAIGLEVALHFSKKNQGWESSGDVENAENALHYVYTLPPVIVAAVLAAMWTWTEFEIKKMQPYVDLAHGDSPPHRSLLLDYTRHNNFFVWVRAAANKHYLVALASLMALLALSLQPLAAALLDVRDTWLSQPGINIFNHRVLGLNQDNQFNDLTAFLTASGYAGASVLYDLGDPPFIKQGYTVGLFDLPSFITNNGSVVTNTTAVKSIPNCQPVTVTMSQTTTGWDNTVNYNQCSAAWSVDRNATTLFGTSLPTCNPPVPPQFSPIIFWFFTYATNPSQASATFCSPRIELWDVTATADIMTGNLTNVKELGVTTTASNFTSLAGNITGPPLNGRAYNGISFNLTDPNEFVGRRLAALQLQLPAAVFQAAVQSPQGIIGSFDADKFVNLATRVYTTYLALVASTVYYLPQTEPIIAEVRSFQKRVFLSDTAVHLLVVAMLLLAVFATLIQVFHRYDRRKLRLNHEPGTIASAVSIGAQTGMADLLSGKLRGQELDRILHGRRFRIDPQTNKIVMEGEEGYELASSPMERRRSIFAALQRQRFSGQPDST